MFKFQHIGIKVKDLEKSVEFYKNVLYGEIVDKHENERVKIVFLNCGGAVVELIQELQNIQDRTTGIIEHLAFHVDNLDREIERLKQLNVKLISEAPMPFEDNRIFFFQGAEGEKLELVGK